MPGAGENMFLGIRLQLDTSGVVTGASVVNKSFSTITNSATTMAKTTTKSVSDVAGTYWKASMAIGAMVGGLHKLDSLIQGKIMDPLINESRDFEVELKRLQFVSGATSAELESMRKRALMIGKTTQMSSTEGVKAMTILRSSGLDLKQTYESLIPAIDAGINDS